VVSGTFFNLHALNTSVQFFFVKAHTNDSYARYVVKCHLLDRPQREYLPMKLNYTSHINVCVKKQRFLVRRIIS